MTEQQQEVMDIHLDIVKKYINEEGEIFPHVTVFGKKVDAEEENLSIINIPLTGNVVKLGEKKFINEVLPTIGKKIRQDFDIYGVSFTAMANMVMISKDEESSEETKKKSDVVVISFEFDDIEDPILRIFEIKEIGSQINESGEMVKQVELTYNKEVSEGATQGMEGEMVGLYKKLNS